MMRNSCLGRIHSPMGQHIAVTRHLRGQKRFVEGTEGKDVWMYSGETRAVRLASQFDNNTCIIYAGEFTSSGFSFSFQAR